MIYGIQWIDHNGEFSPCNNSNCIRLSLFRVLWKIGVSRTYVKKIGKVLIKDSPRWFACVEISKEIPNWNGVFLEDNKDRYDKKKGGWVYTFFIDEKDINSIVFSPAKDSGIWRHKEKNE